MNLNQLNSIGIGALFPIKLEQVLDENGKPEMVTKPDGSQVAKVRWGLTYGSPELIKQNLMAILSYQIGQRIRQEYFGCRIWECIEEPNTQVLEYLIRDFIASSIESWEPRIKKLAVSSSRDSQKVYITIRFRINNTQRVEELNFEYNTLNSTVNAY